VPRPARHRPSSSPTPDPTPDPPPDIAPLTDRLPARWTPERPFDGSARRKLAVVWLLGLLRAPSRRLSRPAHRRRHPRPSCPLRRQRPAVCSTLLPTPSRPQPGSRLLDAGSPAPEPARQPRRRAGLRARCVTPRAPAAETTRRASYRRLTLFIVRLPILVVASPCFSLRMLSPAASSVGQ
jgi:hypothetical protein